MSSDYVGELSDSPRAWAGESPCPLMEGDRLDPSVGVGNMSQSLRTPLLLVTHMGQVE